MRAAVVALAAVAALAGCLSSSGDEPAPAPTSDPSDLQVPAGVDLTSSGSTLAVGDTASVIYAVDDQRRSVASVTVDAIKQGSMKKDFADFSLTAKTRSSTPYYVRTTIENAGPGDLSKAAVPVFGYDTSDTYFPASDLVGRFAKCVGGPLPAKFKAGDTVTRCLVLLVPQGEDLQSVQLRTDDVNAPISWSLPD